MHDFIWQRAESLLIDFICLRMFHLYLSLSLLFHLDSADIWACRDIDLKCLSLVRIDKVEFVALKIAATWFNERNVSLQLTAVFSNLSDCVDTNLTFTVIWWRNLRKAEREDEDVIEFYKEKQINEENVSTWLQQSFLDWWRCCLDYVEMICVHVSCKNWEACLFAFHEFI